MSHEWMSIHQVNYPRTDWSFSASFTWAELTEVKQTEGQDQTLLYVDCEGREESEFDSHDLVIVTAGGSQALSTRG